MNTFILGSHVLFLLLHAYMKSILTQQDLPPAPSAAATSRPGWGGPSFRQTLLPHHTGRQCHRRTSASTHSHQAVPALLMETPQLPLRMVSHSSSNLFSLRQAASVSNGLWMQQEKPTPPGRAVSLLHCSTVMTVWQNLALNYLHWTPNP